MANSDVRLLKTVRDQAMGYYNHVIFSPLSFSEAVRQCKLSTSIFWKFGRFVYDTTYAMAKRKATGNDKYPTPSEIANYILNANATIDSCSAYFDIQVGCVTKILDLLMYGTNSQIQLWLSARVVLASHNAMVAWRRRGRCWHTMTQFVSFVREKQPSLAEFKEWKGKADVTLFTYMAVLHSMPETYNDCFNILVQAQARATNEYQAKLQEADIFYAQKVLEAMSTDSICVNCDRADALASFIVNKATSLSGVLSMFSFKRRLPLEQFLEDYLRLPNEALYLAAISKLDDLEAHDSRLAATKVGVGDGQDKGDLMYELACSRNCDYDDLKKELHLTKFSELFSLMDKYRAEHKRNGAALFRTLNKGYSSPVVRAILLTAEGYLQSRDLQVVCAETEYPMEKIKIEGITVLGAVAHNTYNSFLSQMMTDEAAMNLIRTTESITDTSTSTSKHHASTAHTETDRKKKYESISEMVLNRGYRVPELIDYYGSIPNFVTALKQRGSSANTRAKVYAKLFPDMGIILTKKTLLIADAVVNQGKNLDTLCEHYIVTREQIVTDGLACLQVIHPELASKLTAALESAE